MKHDNTGRDRHQGYLPQKSMIPKTFSDKVDEWRQWQEDVEDFMDTLNPGMKALLQEIDGLEEMDSDWYQYWRRWTQIGHPDKVKDDRVNVWRALKKMTEGQEGGDISEIGGRIQGVVPTTPEV